MKNLRQRITIVAIFLVPMVIYFWMKSLTPHIQKLQVIGEKYYDESLKDTVYHQVPDFEFTDQTGGKVTQNYFDSGATIVNFFFSTCKTVCPKMNGNVLNIYESYLHNPMVHFLSHTVDPETDSAETLNRYATNLHALPNKWKFATGSKTDIYSMAMKGYLLPAGFDSTMPVDSVKFFHSQNLLLIDNHHRIRGFYDGLLSYDIKRLDDELKVLIYEIKQEKLKK